MPLRHIIASPGATWSLLVTTRHHFAIHGAQHKRKITKNLKLLFFLKKKKNIGRSSIDYCRTRGSSLSERK
jgi:hypothetical protein